LRFFPENISPDEVRICREKVAGDDRTINFHAHLENDGGTNIFVGILGLMDIDELNDSCSVGIIVSPEFHRQGIATDALYALLKFAFEDKRLHRVKFETGTDNLMMRGWLENVIGIRQEFQMRECWKDGPGKYVDVLGYGVLKWEWTSTVRDKLEKRLGGLKSHA
jgi:ribosomal-protein-alanine N-acetyltransferase